MILSYSTVPIFTFTILLIFVLLYSPVELIIDGAFYDNCELCLKDYCHAEFNRTCMIRGDKFFCFLCIEENGYKQFYTKEDCCENCKGKNMTCRCNDVCYICIEKGIKYKLRDCIILEAKDFNTTCK